MREEGRGGGVGRREGVSARALTRAHTHTQHEGDQIRDATDCVEHEGNAQPRSTNTVCDLDGKAQLQAAVPQEAKGVGCPVEGTDVFLEWMRSCNVEYLEPGLAVVHTAHLLVE